MRRRWEGQRCLAGEQYPGLYQVPVWALGGKGGPWVTDPAG